MLNTGIKQSEEKHMQQKKDMRTLGARIADLRKAKGLRQDQVAEAVGVSAQAVSKWENDTSCPDILLLPALAEVLGVTVDTLLTGEQPPEAETRYLDPQKRKSFEDMVFHLWVDIYDDDKMTVKINLPMPLVRIAIDTGMISKLADVNSKVQITDIPWEQVIALVEKGMIGKLLEVDSSECKVTIYVE